MSNIKKTLETATELITKYLDENENPETPVVQYQDAESLRESFDFSINSDGVPMDDLFPYIEQYLEKSVRTGHSQYLNQLFAGFNTPSLLGELFTSVTNTSMYTYEIAPVATMMELALIEKMNAITGYENGEGILCAGGSNANLIAVLAARHKAFPESKDNGMTGIGPTSMFISRDAHYSFIKAANLLGIGQNSIIRVDTDEMGRMQPSDLENKIIESKNRGEKPFFVGATAGTTVIGAFDPVEPMATIAQKHGLWLHVDGAWGGPVIMSRKHRHLIKGVELADSFAWDAHKLMGIPLIATAILFREKGNLFNSCSAHGTEYLFHEHDDARYDLGQYSLQCGRKVDALKLWLTWKHFGDRGYEERIDNSFELAKYAAECVNNHKKLEMLAPPQFLNICFRYNPDREMDLNKLNIAIREKLWHSGKSFVNYSWIDDTMVIRLVLANLNLRKSDVDRFFDNLVSTGKALSMQ